MKKVLLTPRSNWQEKFDQLGFYFHSIDGKYWIEEYAIEFTHNEIEKLRTGANEIHAMCLDLVADVIKKGDYEKYRLLPHLAQEIERSWKEEDFHLYGRFDISYDGTDNPKLLEYNADTPTSIVESSVAQENWFKEAMSQYDQFNLLEQKFIERWRQWAKKHPDKKEVHFTCDARSQEDWCNVELVRETAMKAGIKTQLLFLDEIGWSESGRAFIDTEKRKIETLFKLYPWEFMIEDPFYPFIKEGQLKMIEPMWKMLLSTKAILPLLWEKHPNHPNLLPAFWHEEDILKLGVNYVKKPILSREGENVEVYEGSTLVDTEKGGYGKEGFIYQQRKDVACFDGRYSMMGVWMVGDEAVGLGIREDISIITKNTSWFIPHYIKD
jgi:glutathionylspermidine synthase